MAKDLDLFRTAMAGVTPFGDRKPGKKPLPVRATAAKPAKVEAPPAPPPASAGRPIAQPLEDFDRDVDRALSRGRRAPEASLDLHGMTLAAAERAVSRFLAQSVEQRMRVVLIVTGKGLRMEGGKVFGGRIRAEFPAWLERPELRPYVAGMRPAHPRHGGSGAFYVLLRRRAQRA